MTCCYNSARASRNWFDVFDPGHIVAHILLRCIRNFKFVQYSIFSYDFAFYLIKLQYSGVSLGAAE